MPRLVRRGGDEMVREQPIRNRLIRRPRGRRGIRSDRNASSQNVTQGNHDLNNNPQLVGNTGFTNDN